MKTRLEAEIKELDELLKTTYLRVDEYLQSYFETGEAK